MISHILLTNDDGYAAEGLLALWKTVRAVWDAPIRVVAPRVCHSQKSHATITHEPIRVEPLERSPMQGFIADGYPADCVRLGIRGLGLFKEAPPLVLSGINPGANIGMDIYYSGTVAAAREATTLGCPAVAVSQITNKDHPMSWETTIAWATDTLRFLKDRIEKSGPVLWNVNFPVQSGATGIPRIELVPMSTDPLAVGYDPPEDGDFHYRYSGDYFGRPGTPGSDVAALFAGAITVTPLRLDHTASELLK
jgi:5'-nucleotidase